MGLFLSTLIFIYYENGIFILAYKIEQTYKENETFYLQKGPLYLKMGISFKMGHFIV